MKFEVYLFMHGSSKTELRIYLRSLNDAKFLKLSDRNANLSKSRVFKL